MNTKLKIITQNKLSLNFSKSKFICFVISKNRLPSENIIKSHLSRRIDNSCSCTNYIPRSSSVKYFDICIDEVGFTYCHN